MRILCVGQLVTDIIAVPIEYDKLGTDTELVDRILVQNGGDCMNVAINLAKLGGGENVSFCGKIGADSFGSYLTDVFKKFNIDTRGLKVTDKAATSSCIALVNGSGQRVFLYSGGTNNLLTADDANDKLIEECSHLHIGGTYLLPGLDGKGSAELFRKAKDMNKTTSMDVTWDTSGRWLEIIEPCLPYLDLFMPSENEAVKITGKTRPEEMAAFLRDKGVKTAIIKLGENGSYIDSGEEKFYQPAFSANVVDTTGAGDSYVAGFLLKYTKGAVLKDCAKFASGVAAHCIGTIGATAGVPDFETVEKFINNYNGGN